LEFTKKLLRILSNLIHVICQYISKEIYFRQYLRWRDDTVRCVVTSLTEEGPSELADELVRGEALQLDEGTPSDEDMTNWETWNPDPVDADPCKSSRKSDPLFQVWETLWLQIKSTGCDA
jgi:anaphase-promoting complex subunit 2